MCLHIFNSVPADDGWWRPHRDLVLDLFLVHVTIYLRLDTMGLKMAVNTSRAPPSERRACASERGKKHVTTVANKETVIDSG